MSIREVKKRFRESPKGWKVAFYTTQTVAFSLMIGGFFCPPMGVIDGSILTAVGEMFLFPTLYSAVHIILAGQDIKVKYGNMEISSEKDDKKEKETANSAEEEENE